jgi:hypothetical protein
VGVSSVDASRRALALVQRELLRQSATLAYVDALWLMAVGTAFMVPLLFLTRRPPPGGVPAH